MNVCRSIGISKAAVNIWKRKYSDPERAREVRRLRQVEEGNA
jgi:hypothetical protein